MQPPVLAPVDHHGNNVAFTLPSESEKCNTSRKYWRKAAVVVSEQGGPGEFAPRRRRDALANDELLLDAALDLAATEGWAGMGFPRLSAQTGLSLPPIRARFPDRVALATDLWRQRVAGPFAERLQAVVDAVPTPGDAPAGIAAAHEAMLAAIEPFTHPDALLLAASELLVMARFEQTLAEAVDESLREFAHSAFGSHLVSSDQAARNAFALAEALGLLLLSRGGLVPDVEVQGPIRAMVAAMAVDAVPRALPPERAEHLDLDAAFATGDPAWDALLQATLNEVGTRGFDAATLDLIAQASGYSRGIIQNRYASKKAAFLDATQRMLAAAVLLNDDYKRRLGRRYSPGVADAALMREFMDPGRRLVRSISLEQMRMAWHDPEIATAMEAEIARARPPAVDSGGWSFGLALGQGGGLLADLMPQAWLLPYDVVFVPLHEPDGPRIT